MAEVRVQAEGMLRWTQGSGTGRSWATASAPASGVVGFCTDFSYKSALKTVQPMDRGVPTHHKVVGLTPIEVNFSFLWTGADFAVATASGASVPHCLLEFKSNAPELGSGSGFYYQFYGCLRETTDFSEAEEGNPLKLTFKGLGMSGANASGYLG